MFFVLLVLHDNCQLEDVLNAWEVAGAPGVTILPSSGLVRLRNNHPLDEDMPLMPSLNDFFSPSEEHNSTLFTVVKGEEMVEKLVAATESVTGDLDLPNTGILVVMPVVRAYGLMRKALEE